MHCSYHGLDGLDPNVITQSGMGKHDAIALKKDSKLLVNEEDDGDYDDWLSAGWKDARAKTTPDGTQVVNASSKSTCSGSKENYRDKIFYGVHIEDCDLFGS